MDNHQISNVINETAMEKTLKVIDRNSGSIEIWMIRTIFPVITSILFLKSSETE